jgi:hypothetical protein
VTLEGKRVLVIGSSSIGERGTGALGKALQELLPGAQLWFYGRSGYGFAGSSSKRIAGNAEQRSSLLSVLRELEPIDRVLVVMGSNPTGTAAELREAMQWLAAEVGLGRLLWVGPPVYSTSYEQGITNTYDAVGPTVLGSHYVSSHNWTDPTWGRAADKVHFTLTGARKWAQGIVSWVQGQSGAGWALPILLLVTGVGAYLYFRRRR